MQIMIDLPNEDVAWLDRNAPFDGISRDEMIREALRQYRSVRFNQALDVAFGLWKKHGFTEDGDAYQQRIRAEWDREWDMPTTGNETEALKAAE